ncbi:hypothetical protein BU17DRAFT_71281 [Hysterangium stoloniferum]|nr:hypothetical protein BU17DRAFT_71281 [Hysterangium stoloniferum]
MEDFTAAEKFKSQSHQGKQEFPTWYLLLKLDRTQNHIHTVPAAFSSAMSFESEELNDFGSESPSIHEPYHSNSIEQPTSSGPYIRVVHHPHSGLPDDFIYRDDNIPSPSTGEALLHPWARFRSRADFEFAQLNVDAGLSAEFTKRMLKGVTGSWVDPEHGKVTFSRLDDYKAGLEAGGNWVPEFKKSSISEMYDGKEYTFDFYHRDPWQWILSLVTDATLPST